MYACLCLNDYLVAVVLHSLSTSTTTQMCLPKVVSHVGLNAPTPLPTLPSTCHYSAFYRREVAFSVSLQDLAKHPSEEDGGLRSAGPSPLCEPGVRR